MPASDGAGSHEHLAALLTTESLEQHNEQQQGSTLRERRASVQSVDSSKNDETRLSPRRLFALPWVEWFAASIGASPAPRAWRIFVNGVVAAVVGFETFWWVAVAWREREQATVCFVGATLDAARGVIATVAQGGCALLVARAWLHALLADPTAGAPLDATARRWVLGASIYVGMDTAWMLYLLQKSLIARVLN